ncbi:MAG TPA: exodeoxyribonuclease V subunit gamma [Gammaproteobacteria bacterium]|nr:exodeoxyribonuclease V subunit gamma [Gammaproteobacteria bacterium]
MFPYFFLTPATNRQHSVALQLISSNRIESLLDELARRLAVRPLASPFDAEVIVVPSPAMARWVNLQLAQAHGVAANLQYPLPASWVWALTGQVLDDTPDTDPLERQRLGWKIFALLPTLLAHPAFQPLQHYLRDDSDDLKRWQLSARIADVLDRYQFYRPALIRQWSRGEGDDWQALLWRELVADLGDSHRVAVLDRLLQRLQRGDSSVPERISLFALSTLPPLFVDVLHALAARGEVSLYLHSPTDQYWADLKSKKALSRLRIETPDEAAYFDTGHELLASWGRQGQALQDLLLNHDGLQAAEWEDYRPPAADSLLHHIQQDIFHLDPQPATPGADDSVQLHVCHSPLRECQILHDQLLHALDADDTLKPEHILVMVPEISRYAPFIEAVFRKDESAARPFIPWNLSDITIADEHPLIRIFFQLLALPESRFSHTEVMSYLDVPELNACFGLDETACEDIRTLLDEAQLRWGLDEAHKEELGLPAYLENTWRQAGQRLFAGYALGEIDYWDGIAPLAGTEGGKAESIGRFWLLFERLCHYRRELVHERGAADWQRLLNRLLDDFFLPGGEDDGRLQQIRDVLDELHQQAGEQLLSPELLRLWLQHVLGQQTLHGRYFSGGVTFCGMRPMRSLPFRIICLLGMNDPAFPRREQAAEFDRMTDHWHPGDPRKGDEDRYLMLETLLCARQTLYISYSGRDMKDNSERQPSVLVRELFDFIDERYSLADSTPLSERITHEHPLQPFSARNYTPGDASYDRYWCRVAEAMRVAGEPASEQAWPDTPLPLAADEARDIDLKHLCRFLQHPVKYFFQQRLHVYLREELADEDDEPFDLAGLQRWFVKQRLLDDFLQQRPDTEAVLRAQGLLPHGVFADLGLDRAQAEVQTLYEQLQDYAGTEFSPRVVDMALADGIRLAGQITRYLPGRGLLHASASKLKGKSLLALWLDHLALCASEQLAVDEYSLLLCSDKPRRFPPVAKALAVEQLQAYVDLYRQGLECPLPIFPLASFAWAMAGGEKKAMTAARGKWSGNDFQNIPGDKDDLYIQLSLRGLSADPLSHPQFTELANALYASALQYGEET